MSKLRYEKSHLIDAQYFIQDRKHKVTGGYSTNSHGKRIASAYLKGEYDSKINFGSYQEVKAARDMLEKILKETKGKWITSPEKRKEKERIKLEKEQMKGGEK